MVQRYEDYYDAMEASDSDNFRRSKQAPSPPLPYPFNKGEDWYAEAVNVIKKDVVNFEFVGQWRWFWSQLKIFGEFHELFDKSEEEHRRGPWAV